MFFTKWMQPSNDCVDSSCLRTMKTANNDYETEVFYVRNILLVVTDFGQNNIGWQVNKEMRKKNLMT